MQQNDNVNQLYHHGVPGQKWGIRRYQNKDGSLTAAGRKRADKLKKQYTELTGKRMKRNPISKNEKVKEPKRVVKSYKDLTNEELISRTNRANIETNYLNSIRNLDRATPKQISRGKRFINSLGNDVILPAVRERGKLLFGDWLENTVREKMGIENPKAAKKTISGIKKEVTNSLPKTNSKSESKKEDSNQRIRNEAESLELELRRNMARDALNQYNSKKTKTISNKKETKPRTEAEIEGQMVIDDIFKRKKN